MVYQNDALTKSYAMQLAYLICKTWKIVYNWSVLSWMNKGDYTPVVGSFGPDEGKNILFVS